MDIRYTSEYDIGDIVFMVFHSADIVQGRISGAELKVTEDGMDFHYIVDNAFMNNPGEVRVCAEKVYGTEEEAIEALVESITVHKYPFKN